MARKQKIRGAGDVISKITETLGIEECDGCAARKDVMNLATMFPFKKVTKMDNQSKEQFKTILERKNQKTLTNDESLIILDLYGKHFNIKIEPCNTCGSVYKAILQQLTKLYNYEN
jgi:hypothetical protein